VRRTTVALTVAIRIRGLPPGTTNPSQTPFCKEPWRLRPLQPTMTTNADSRRDHRATAFGLALLAAGLLASSGCGTSKPAAGAQPPAPAGERLLLEKRASREATRARHDGRVSGRLLPPPQRLGRDLPSRNDTRSTVHKGPLALLVACLANS
jgi:hypothetical protein